MDQLLEQIREQAPAIAAIVLLVYVAFVEGIVIWMQAQNLKRIRERDSEGSRG